MRPTALVSPLFDLSFPPRVSVIDVSISLAFAFPRATSLVVSESFLSFPLLIGVVFTPGCSVIA